MDIVSLKQDIRRGTGDQHMARVIELIVFGLQSGTGEAHRRHVAFVDTVCVMDPVIENLVAVEFQTDRIIYIDAAVPGVVHMTVLNDGIRAIADDDKTA